MPISPPRLYVIPARDKPLAVILMRGPSAWYHVIRWNTARDTFEHGAWFKGRIYEERCDVSPDGELFLYFALQGSRWTTPYKGAWSAVSRPPWLHALVLWPQGHTWGGGGRFSGSRSIVLNACSLHAHPDHPLVGLEVKSGPVTPHAVHVEDAGAAIEGASWSGRDHAGRVVYAAVGKLYRRGTRGDVEITDFNGLTPEPRPAPEWATSPLPP